MESLSASQSIAVARDLKKIARAIDDYQMNNWSSLSKEQHVALNKAERDILFKVQDIIAQTMTILVDDAQEFIDAINGLSANLEQKLKQIENINRVIVISAASVALASALVSQNPAAIGLSIKKFTETLAG